MSISKEKEKNLNIQNGTVCGVMWLLVGNVFNPFSSQNHLFNPLIQTKTNNTLKVLYSLRFGRLLFLCITCCVRGYALLLFIQITTEMNTKSNCDRFNIIHQFIGKSKGSFIFSFTQIIEWISITPPFRFINIHTEMSVHR